MHGLVTIDKFCMLGTDPKATGALKAQNFSSDDAMEFKTWMSDDLKRLWGQQWSSGAHDSPEFSVVRPRY